MARRRRRGARWTEAATTTAARTRTEGDLQFPAAAYAYVPDGSKPSTWRLRLWETPADKETAKQVSSALALLSPGGLAGKKVTVPAEALPVVKRRIMAAWRRVHPDAKAEDVPAALQEAFPSGRTFMEVSGLVEDAIEDKIGVPDGQPGGGVYIRDISDSWAVYCVNWGDDLFRVDYSIDDAGEVTLGQPEKVDQQTTYVTATEATDRIAGRVLEAKGTDSAGGRVFRVRIIAYGDSKNGRRYPESVMRSAVRLYEGAKAYDHHRTEAELQTSTISGLVGSYQDVEATGEGLDADLHLLPSAAHTAEAFEQSLENQDKGLPPLVGISHDVMARYRPIQSGGRRFMEATEICSVNSADVVADPAAGGRATRMVAGGTGGPTLSEEDDMTLKELLALLKGASPEKRAELLKEHAAVLDDAGLTADDIVFDPVKEPEKELVDAGGGGTGGGEPAKEAVQRGTEAATFGRDSAMGRMLIRSAIADAKIDERMTESVTRLLPDQFTEADLANRIGLASTMATEFEKAGLAPKIGHSDGVAKDELDKKADRLFESLDPKGPPAGGYRSIKQAFFDISGMDPRQQFGDDDLNRIILRECLGTGRVGVRGTESISTSTFNTILGDSITRRMIASYALPSLQDWRQIVSSIVPVNDFRTQRLQRMGGYGLLPVVNEGAPYQPLTTPGNEEATYALTKKGGTEDLTLEMIANDDLGAVAKIPRALGTSAAATLYNFVFELIAANPTLYDSVALFHATHANTDTNALSDANVMAGRKKMRKQKDYGNANGIPLSTVPKFLLAVSDLEEMANWVTGQFAPGANAGTATGANITNLENVNRTLTPIVVDYWTSTTAWYLVADPNMIPTIEIGFYQGRQEPELFVQSDPTVGSPFDADKITYKIRHIYSGTVLDFRGFYRGNA